jgi:hypothetical protein
MDTQAEQKQEWRFCVSGNIVKTHLDEEGVVRYGAKAFSGGTKVYLYRNTSVSGDDILVIGKNRFGRYAMEAVPLAFIENIRFQTVFKPTVLEIMGYDEAIEGADWWGRTAADKREAKAFVEMLNERKKFSEEE